MRGLTGEVCREIERGRLLNRFGRERERELADLATHLSRGSLAEEDDDKMSVAYALLLLLVDSSLFDHAIRPLWHIFVEEWHHSL